MSTGEKPGEEGLPAGTGAGPVLSAGKATRGLILLAFAAMLFVGGLLIYALNQPVREAGRTAAAGTPPPIQLGPGEGRTTGGQSSR